MKNILKFTMIMVLTVVYTSLTYAQAMQESLNQVELMKQLTGTWKNESIKDTVYTAEFKPYGNGGLELSLRSVTQGKVWLEMKQLWGYDKKNDKIVIAGLVKDSPNLMLQAAWFTNKNTLEQVPFEFASDAKKATFVVTFDFKSSDVVVREEIVNSKSLGTETYTRVKN
jgi:Cu/Ag efflux protein CusF